MACNLHEDGHWPPDHTVQRPSPGSAAHVILGSTRARVLDLQVADEAGSAVRRAKVQDWQPREPPRSAAGLSAWADGLVAYLQVRLLARAGSGWQSGTPQT